MPRDEHGGWVSASYGLVSAPRLALGAVVYVVPKVKVFELGMMAMGFD